MPSFADSIFLFVLALLLFGPKKLPVLARELGKWVGEFRRASNEFKIQMEEELRASEQTDRQKQIAAMEAAAPVPPPLGEPAEPEHPHLRPRTAPASVATSLADGTDDTIKTAENADTEQQIATHVSSQPADRGGEETLDGVRPIPIATSGELHMMPPATGLPTPRGRSTSPLGGGLLDSIPESAPGPSPATDAAFAEAAQEATAHGD